VVLIQVKLISVTREITAGLIYLFFTKRNTFVYIFVVHNNLVCTNVFCSSDQAGAEYTEKE